jgi:NAD-reducing hydrogenase large subunit
VTQIARRYIHNGQASNGILNRLEAGIRAYDPCLSCSTHAIGQMPLVVDVIDAGGKVLNQWKRDGV